MGHRARTIFVMLLALGALLALFASGSRWLFLDSFSELEAATMQTEVMRAKESILYELDQIDTITTDYSGWDEAYQFVRDRNPAFIKSNLADAVFSKLKLNFIGYFDHSGRVVYSRFFDFHSNRELPLPTELATQLSPGALLLKHTSDNTTHKGFVSIPSGILMTVSQPVLTSDYQGPARGTLVMARYIDTINLRSIAERTKRSLALWPAQSPGRSAEVAAARQKLKDVRTIHLAHDHASIRGYVQFDDIYGNEAFILQVESPRTILHQGNKTINSFLALFVCLVLVSTIGIYTVFERLTSSLKRQRESETRYHTLVDRAAEGIVLVTREGYFILDANPAFAALTGKTVQEMRGCSLLELFEGSTEELEEEFGRILNQTRELKLRHRSGEIFFAEVNASCISHEERPVLSVIIHNVTERKNFEDQLMYQANHDPLTGLPNRILLNDRLSHALAAAQRKNGHIVIMLLDLDHFKVINDTMGHTFGDLLLKEVASRFQDIIRACDTIARIGGDEFVAVLTTLERSDDVITVAQRFLENISRPYNLQGHEINLTASIGIAQYPEDGHDAEMLFKKADTAMYNVKELGRNGIQFYADEMNQKISKRMTIESHLRHALELDELSLHYQPQIDLTTGRIIGMEALLRWNSRNLGPVSPADFISVAEESGLIVPLGKWALRSACLQYRHWTEQGLPPLRMAVNLSPRQFGQKDLVEMVSQIIDESGIEPAMLDLEVTESLMMNNVEDSIVKMKALKQLGLSLSIDDFGTGYSSLNCLQRFPLDILKIDRSFVLEIGTGGKSVIIRAIVAMAHSLGLAVVAEGVETVEQLNFLRNHRCEEVQGYYFSRPLPADQFLELVLKTVDYHASISMSDEAHDYPEYITQPMETLYER